MTRNQLTDELAERYSVPTEQVQLTLEAAAIAIKAKGKRVTVSRLRAWAEWAEEFKLEQVRLGLM